MFQGLYNEKNNLLPEMLRLFILKFVEYLKYCFKYCSFTNIYFLSPGVSLEIQIC